MNALVRETDAAAPSSLKLNWGIVSVVVGLTVLLAFLVSPGSIAAKTHFVLHGICSQRPSHSFQLGGAPLPLDARMTGLYIGAVTNVLCLIAAGRLRAVRIPPGSVIAILALFLSLLALDGFNSLAVDLGLPHPYAPSNSLRLLTGILAGTTIGAIVALLLAATMWSNGDHQQAVILKPTELVAPLCLAAAVGILVASGLPILYAPIAVGLVLAAVSMFGVLAIVLLALSTGRAWTCHSYCDLVPMAWAGGFTATIFLGLLSIGRSLVEDAFGLSQLT